MKLKHFYFNPFHEHCGIISDDRGIAVAVDPGAMTDDEKESLPAYLQEENLTLAAILLTHAHFDHVFAVKFLQDRYGIPVFLHPDDREILESGPGETGKFGMPAPDISFISTDIEDGQTLEFGTLKFKVIHTPGHTPGGVCYYDWQDAILFSGDTLFAGTIGRSDLRGGDYDKEILSIMEKLMVLDSDTELFPGHGLCSSIGRERTTNPFLEPFNEPEETSLQEEDDE